MEVQAAGNIGQDETTTYIEVEIPYSLFQFLNSANSNVQSICRICLSTNCDVMYPLVSTSKNSLLADMFVSLTAVRLSSEDGLPTSICESCQSLVLHCYEFKIKCEKSDYMLRSVLKGEYVAKEEPTQTIITDTEDISKVEIKVEDYVEDVQYLEENLSDEVGDDDNILLVQGTDKKKSKRNTKVNFLDSPEFLSKLVLGTMKSENKLERYNNMCVHCSKSFTTVNALKVHIRKKHGDIQLHQCSQCKLAFQSLRDLEVHSALHAKGALWKCNQCHKEFNSKTTLRRHVQRHMENKPYICMTCGKTFTEMYALRRHFRVHTGETIEKKHACHICDKRYSESGLLAAHVSRHAGARPCACVTCGKRFASARLLASHARIHTDRKPYACDFCEKRFRHESTRNTHHRTHTGEKPYVCSVCGKSFIQNSNLTLHMRTHTGERPYVCKVCDSKFTSGSSLKNHERIHSGERPYSCNICGKKFARMNLGAHMRQHSGERPFACSVCPRKFTNATRLRDHCRTHTGEKPFECANCNMKFTTKSHLAKHLKKHDASKKNSKQANERLILQKDLTINPQETNEQLVRAAENTDVMEPTDITESVLDIVHEVPLEVTGELILQDDSNMKGDLLVVDNSQNNYQIGNELCLIEHGQ